MAWSTLTEFIIPGKVKAKQRHRSTKSGHTYTPKETVLAENWVRSCVVDAIGADFIPKDCPVRIAYMRVVCTVPKSWSKKKKAEAFLGDIYPMVKPDLDNVEKLIADALNGILWVDDKQIVQVLSKERIYGPAERVELGVQFNEL